MREFSFCKITSDRESRELATTEKEIWLVSGELKR